MPRKYGSSFFNFVQVVDCRVCGDPNSVLRFAFVEFTDEGASNYWLFHSRRLICLVTYIISHVLYRRCKECFKSCWNYAWILPCKGTSFKNCNCSCESNLLASG